MDQNHVVPMRKVKTGCLTCKLRRVKCDEAKPHCRRCEKSKKQCLGYGITPNRALMRRHPLGIENPDAFGSLVNLSGQLTIVIPGNAEEQRYFEFFCSQTLPNVNGGFHCPFWEKDVVQMSMVDPAVRHAIVALASVHKETDLKALSAPRLDETSFSTQQYVKSMHNLQQRLVNANEQGLGIILACCIIFTACEAIRGNPTEAMLHLRNGLKIISERELSSSPFSSPERSTASALMPVFLRLNVQARSLLRPALPEYFQMNQTFPPYIPDTFSSLTQARDVMATIFNKGYSIISKAYQSKDKALKATKPNTGGADEVDRPPPKTPYLDEMTALPDAECIKEEILSLINRMDEWHSAFGRMIQKMVMESPSRSLSDSDLQGATLLRIHNISGQIALKTSGDLTSFAFDAWRDEFRKLVSLASDLISLAGWDKSPCFSIDMGVIGPLYFVVTSCRDPWIRRDAIRLLQKLIGRKEGAWDARVAASVGEWYVGVEEGYIHPDSGIWSVPEGRVRPRSEAMDEIGGVPDELWVQGRAFVTLGTLSHSKPVLQGDLARMMSGDWGKEAVEDDDEQHAGFPPYGTKFSILDPPPDVTPKTVRRITRLHAEIDENTQLIKLVPLLEGQAWEDRL